MTSEDPEGAEGDRPNRSKVGRVIDHYGLTGLGDELERRWVGEGAERMSLRDLAAYFNRRLLESALEEAGERPIDGEVANLVELLQGRGTSGSGSAQAEAKLRRVGVDVERLQGDFVSHQAIHTYLTAVREVRPPNRGESGGSPIQRRRTTIQRLRNRLGAVTEQSLGSLSSSGHLTVGSIDVLVSISIYCGDCETSLALGELFEQGGCGCGVDG